MKFNFKKLFGLVWRVKFFIGLKGMLSCLLVWKLVICKVLGNIFCFELFRLMLFGVIK